MKVQGTNATKSYSKPDKKRDNHLAVRGARVGTIPTLSMSYAEAFGWQTGIRAEARAGPKHHPCS
jgi:hypothetical protein